jgi:acyl-CoA thioesterase I
LPRSPETTALFFGDSYVVGYGDREGLGWVGRVTREAVADGIDLTTYNLGVRGQTSSEVAARWQAELPGRDHGEVRLVFSFGANDAAPGDDGEPQVDPAASRQTLELVLAGAAALDLPVLLVGPAPYGDDAQMDRIGELSDSYAAICASEGAKFIDLVRPLRESAVWREQIMLRDGAHPDAEGYAELAAIGMAGGIVDWLRGAPEPPKNRAPTNERGAPG